MSFNLSPRKVTQVEPDVNLLNSMAEPASLCSIGLDLSPLLVPSTSEIPQFKLSEVPKQCVVLPAYKVFIDRVLPQPNVDVIKSDPNFTPKHYVRLYEQVSAPSPYHKSGTPNYMGARIPLRHNRLNVSAWKRRLAPYENREILQFIEFGFPLGLQQEPPPVLEPALQNHGSAYRYFMDLDEFLCKGLMNRELTGPFRTPPFYNTHISPLMTAPKKPDARRAVFDATFGDFSLNKNTPEVYYHAPYEYDFPQVDDFKQLVVSAGQGCFLWKRDLARYYLQIPLDPLDYPNVGFIWRGKFYFFTSLMFGLKHSGLQGQRLTSAVKWIHHHMGINTPEKEPFHSLNYSDDIGGCEKSEERAHQAYEALGSLLRELNLEESTTKAHPPDTCMPYLGVCFNTIDMTMSIPAEKLEELREELSLWTKKKRASKKHIQQLLGKLFWVSRCVKYSRGFMARLLAQLRILHHIPDNKSLILPEDCKEDIKWWYRHVRRFNGVELLFSEEPLPGSVNELISSNANVCCGDAQLNGGGAYFRDEFWSREFPPWLIGNEVPIHLKEFWVVIASAILWGNRWRGSLVYIFCDNSAVVQVLEKESPRDDTMAGLLREFLYIVCSRGFTPVFRHIGTQENYIADFLSRHHDSHSLETFLERNMPCLKNRKIVPDASFKPHSTW